jgi:hypothetical protein
MNTRSVLRIDHRRPSPSNGAFADDAGVMRQIASPLWIAMQKLRHKLVDSMSSFPAPAGPVNPMTDRIAICDCDLRFRPSAFERFSVPNPYGIFRSR